MGEITFINDDADFSIKNPENYTYLYFPIAGEGGLKSSITPTLGGDGKISQEAFLLEPVSSENLHSSRSSRNFWVVSEKNECWSAAGASAEHEFDKFSDRQDKSGLEAGFMWQSVKRRSEKYMLESKITSFVAVNENIEIMHVSIRNISSKSREITPIAAVPIYGRSADNIRDHRNVTSLLHRIWTDEYGVFVKPTMSFDEKGHRENDLTYFVLGAEGNGEKPVSFYPSVEGFIGEGGTFTHPAAVFCGLSGEAAGAKIDGKEAMGGIRFKKRVLSSDEAAEYVVILGVTRREGQIDEIISKYVLSAGALNELCRVKKYWQEKVNVRYHTGDSQFDLFMRWVSFQPILRRIYGCSFLPHHDYGRGGRGWRDLWQDCLSLLLMDPDGVRQMILDNFKGVRIDGTNATIIGSGRGEFVADRNGISRVWMDHGMWPFMTVKLYIDQTGDVQILLEDVPYFKDSISMRGAAKDGRWSEDDGMELRTSDGAVYEGTVLEHLLLENLCAFYEVGAHNEIRLRNADWNDALDMASENGESVAFTCAYAGNLRQLADCLRVLSERTGLREVKLLAQAKSLLGHGDAYESVEKKRGVLNDYLSVCEHDVVGVRENVKIWDLIDDLESKASWMMGNIRGREWIDDGGDGWFNSYYDNSSNAVEGFFNGGVRMMLTGQVFAIMSGTADEGQVKKICRSADRYLYDASIGGYRLNTDFKEMKFDLGRMFGFAYGEKENGAVFSHMAAMYANALYKRGFAKEGYKALKALSDAALNFDKSRIYPGIPEYFNGEGRGMYHYLTGAASWYMMTVITEAFGVRGASGDLEICPKLVRGQFDEGGTASVTCFFAGRRVEAEFKNAGGLDYGEYEIESAFLNGARLYGGGSRVVIKREELQKKLGETCRIEVRLAARAKRP